MAATTVKLESSLLQKIAEFKPARQTLAAFVREALESDLRRRKMRAAAEAYQTFLEANSAEHGEMDQWEQADLLSVPKRKRR